MSASGEFYSAMLNVQQVDALRKELEELKRKHTELLWITGRMFSVINKMQASTEALKEFGMVSPQLIAEWTRYSSFNEEKQLIRTIEERFK